MRLRRGASSNSRTTVDPAAHITSVIDLLLTIGYVDRLLHQDEQAFIREYLWDRTGHRRAIGCDALAATLISQRA